MGKIHIFITTILFFTSIQLHSQNASLQIGFGMNQNLYSGYTHIIDSFLIMPHLLTDEFRPIGAISFQKRINNKFEIEAGINYSKTYFSYLVGIYDQTFNSFTKKVGSRVANTFTFPININIALTKKLYVKAGLSVSLGVLGSSNPVYFNNIPEINDIYNSMQNIFKPNSINYGFGCGYKIWKFDLVYFRKVAMNKVAKSINVNDVDYKIFDRCSSNSISLYYNIMKR